MASGMDLPKPLVINIKWIFEQIRSLDEERSSCFVLVKNWQEPVDVFSWPVVEGQ